MKKIRLSCQGILLLAVACANLPAAEVKVDFGSPAGPVKPVNAVGQPPLVGKLKNYMMFHYLKEAGIPYSRLHDVDGWLGGGLFVDIPNLFPDFDADETDPKNYRFAYTDSLLKALDENGVEPFFRLGVTIENFAAWGYPPVNTRPPKDYAKWARICEHVIRHYTEGWADGFRMKITYWEIWNEPENHPDDNVNPMFRAPFSEYIRLYGTVAPYLKSKFPHLKIGGYGHCGFYAGAGSDHIPAANSSPRMAYFVECSHKFLAAVRDNKWPLDFFSYHSYSPPPEALRQVRFADEHLNAYGFTADKCERIFNEWLPYVKHENLGSALQAAGVAAELIGLQNGPCDLACIYDARCGIGNYSPLFNPLTYKPHKAYYAFTAFNELRKRGTAVAVQVRGDTNLWATAALGENDAAVMLANDSDRAIPLVCDFQGRTVAACRITDADRTDCRVPFPDALPPRSFAIVLLKEAEDPVRRVEPSAASQGTTDPDPRTRTYVGPVRVVWQTPGNGEQGAGRCSVKDAESLLKRHYGQVPEGGWTNRASGCRLVNDGEAPGVLLDFGRELHGGVQIGLGSGPKGMRVRLRFGESVSETLSEIGEKRATNDHAIRDDVVGVPSFGTREIGNTGFRFLRIDLVTPGSITLEFVRAVELMRPMERLGAFRCSDERLNRIWETALRTVHLCCQDYLWDGIKRDRLVWMGDTHPETMAILNVFGAQPILPESLDLMAAVTKPDEWMNTMGPYTLWWIRNVAEWYRFTGDKAYLEKHHDYIRATFANLEKYITPSNTLEGIRRPFLDWPTEHNLPAVHSGMQALALITWREGAFLADELGDGDLAANCRRTVARFETLRGKLEPHGSKQAAAMLALSGLREPKEMFAQVLGRDGVHGMSTFYGYYMLEAMSAAGEDRFALNAVRDYWGAMLDVGATSFWEDFNVDWTNNCFRIDELPVAGKKDIHGDYGEFCYSGFRHSLCHGWSCGPVQWCIAHVLGLEALDVGGRTVRVKPFLGDLEWAEGALPTAQGIVRVRHEKRPDGSIATKIDAPPGVKTTDGRR